MSVKYSPFGNSQFVDENGDPAVGWKIYTYVAGSSTEQATYTTADGDVANANPIILDALGKPENQIWLTDGASYKFILKNASDVEKDTQDNIFGVNASESDASQWVPSGLTPTYISATSFSLVGDQTTDFHVGRREQFTTTAGTVYGTILTTAYTTLTTVTMTMDSGQTLDSGLSVVNHSILTAVNPALPNSVAARTALGANLEPGLVAMFCANAAPTGWLKANGATISRSTYAALFAAIGVTFGVGDGSTTFALPDLRGEFIRGWDDSRGIDTSRAFGSAQSGAIEAHIHSMAMESAYASGAPGYVGPDLSGTGSETSLNTNSTGGTETRPRNIALLACIKY